MPISSNTMCLILLFTFAEKSCWYFCTHFFEYVFILHKTHTHTWYAQPDTCYILVLPSPDVPIVLRIRVHAFCLCMAPHFMCSYPKVIHDTISTMDWTCSAIHVTSRTHHMKTIYCVPIVVGGYIILGFYLRRYPSHPHKYSCLCQQQMQNHSNNEWNVESKSDFLLALHFASHTQLLNLIYCGVAISPLSSLFCNRSIHTSRKPWKARRRRGWNSIKYWEETMKETNLQFIILL